MSNPFLFVLLENKYLPQSNPLVAPLVYADKLSISFVSRFC